MATVSWIIGGNPPLGEPPFHLSCLTGAGRPPFGCQTAYLVVTSMTRVNTTRGFCMRLFRRLAMVLVLFAPLVLIAPTQLARQKAARPPSPSPAPVAKATPNAGSPPSAGASHPAQASLPFRVSAVPPGGLAFSSFEYEDEPELFRDDVQVSSPAISRVPGLSRVDELVHLRALGLRAPLIP